MSLDSTPTRPTRLPAPNPAPNKPTECARCGAPAISARGVALHDLDHRARDIDAKRQKALLERLEALLDSIETNVDQATGKRLTLGDWIHQTDEALDTVEHALDPDGDGWIRKALAEIAEAVKGLAAPAAPAADGEILPWPGNPWTPDEDETIEPDEEELEPAAADDRDPDDIIPSSATHSFPGDGPAALAAQRERDAREIADDVEPDEDLLAAHDDDTLAPFFPAAQPEPDDDLGEPTAWGTR